MTKRWLFFLLFAVQPIFAQTVFTDSNDFQPVNRIDQFVLADLKAHGIKPAPRCSDAVFIRRAFLDVLGRLPSAERVRQFLLSQDPKKREKLVDEVLNDPGYADYWSMRYGDVLRVKAEFPINLWPNGVQAYHRWIYDALRQNMPYDVFARELLSSNGSNFRVPQVNFYRAIQGEKPQEIARAVALTFMGMRTDSWSQKTVADFSQFFSRLTFKPTAEWKETIVCLNPEPVEPKHVTMPDGREVLLDGETDPRKIFVGWLLAEENPYFARHGVNRIWYWLMGKGIIDPVDDVRSDSRAVNPELLNELSREFKTSKFNIKHILRLILNSRTYASSSSHPEESLAEKHFAVYSVRRLDAELIIDALRDIFGREGDRERYRSEIPEPFTFIPATQRSISLADASISSPFLETFGRPPRDTGFLSERKNEPTRAQRLYLLNGSKIQRMINTSPAIQEIFMKHQAEQSPINSILEEVYLRIFSRFPTSLEVKQIQQALREQRQAKDVSPQDKINRKDVLWALINSKEFLFRH